MKSHGIGLIGVMWEKITKQKIIDEKEVWLYILHEQCTLKKIH